MGLAACQTDTIYHKYHAIQNKDGWQKTDTLLFELTSDLTQHRYNMEIGIRHSELYPYQDIWIGVRRPLSPKYNGHTAYRNGRRRRKLVRKRELRILLSIDSAYRSNHSLCSRQCTTDSSSNERQRTERCSRRWHSPVNFHERRQCAERRNSSIVKPHNRRTSITEER